MASHHAGGRIRLACTKQAQHTSAHLRMQTRRCTPARCRPDSVTCCSAPGSLCTPAATSTATSASPVTACNTAGQSTGGSDTSCAHHASLASGASGAAEQQPCTQQSEHAATWTAACSVRCRLLRRPSMPLVRPPLPSASDARPVPLKRRWRRASAARRRADFGRSKRDGAVPPLLLGVCSLLAAGVAAACCREEHACAQAAASGGVMPMFGFNGCSNAFSRARGSGQPG